MVRVVMRTGLATLLEIALLFLPLSAFGRAFNLRDFNASGAGDTTAIGTIAEGQITLTVDSTSTWTVGHGIRVTRAGDDAPVDDADSAWEALVPAATVAHDTGDYVQGAASARCTLAPATTGPVDVCGVDLGSERSFDFDELRLWIKSSAATAAGDLQLVLASATADVPQGRMGIPALAADTWTELFVPIEGAAVDRVQRVRLACRSNCGSLDVHLDDLGLVQDLIGTVQQIQPGPGSGGTLVVDVSAGRTVVDETVYHDDTLAVFNWLRSAEHPATPTAVTNLLAPAGVYYVNRRQIPLIDPSDATASLPIYNSVRLGCEGPDATTFRNTGRSGNGMATMFRSASPIPTRVQVINCGFDANGWNARDGLTMVELGTRTIDRTGVLRVRGSHFWDSRPPGTAGCNLGTSECATKKRTYVVTRHTGDRTFIQGNRLEGGGVAGWGTDIYVNANTIDFVNGSAIAIGSVGGPCPGDCVTDYHKIRHNEIRNTVGPGVIFGLEHAADDAPDIELERIFFFGNHISGTFGTAGILFTLPAQVHNIVIKGNTIEANAPPAGAAPPVAIQVIRSDVTPDPANDVRVEANTIVASGTGSLGGGGVITDGSMTALRVSHNTITCSDCPSAVWLRSGPIVDVDVIGNAIAGAGHAIQLGQLGVPTFPALSITGAIILANDLSNSTDGALGQITVDANPGELIEGTMSKNSASSGAGYGILCRGVGTLRLTGLATNTVIGNAAGGISGCP